MKCINWLLTGLLLFSFTAINAQDEFANLSSKERISIAEAEKENAKNDAVFQQLMSEGHELFKNKHYLKAIHKYEEAQDKRPYNVFPKVIISDIELSMKDTLEILREKERKLTLEPKKEELKEDTEPQKPETQTEAVRQAKLEEWEREERERLQKAREKNQENSAPTDVSQPAGDVPVMSIEEFKTDLGKRYPVGLTETTKTEGNKTIITRVLVKDGKGDEYKKVVHNWGGIFYFKNGQAVPERVWKSETE